MLQRWPGEVCAARSRPLWLFHFKNQDTRMITLFMCRKNATIMALENI